MAAINNDALIRRFETDVRGRRGNWEHTWDILYELAFPGRQSWFEESPGQVRSDRIYDSTLMDSVAEFASRIAFGLTPNFSEWFRIEVGPTTAAGASLEEISQIQQALDEVTRYAFNVISASNFQPANHELMLDLSVGYSVMEITEHRDPVRVLDFATLPQTEMYLSCAGNGFVDGSYRRYKLKHDQIPIVYPEARPPAPDTKRDKANDEHCLVDAVVRDWSQRGTEVWERRVWVEGTESYQSSVIWEDTYKGKGANPRLTPRWLTTPFEAYGRGPAFIALPDARTANLAQQMILENAEMAIAGMWQMDDDGVINPNTIKLVPGTLIPRAPDSRGLEPLESPSRFDIAELMLEKLRSQIRRTMFNMDFGNESAKTPRSATEISERASNQAGRISSPFARLMVEYIEPLVDRVLYILKDRNLVKIPRIDGTNLQVVSRSPLARQQRLEEVYNLTQLAGIAGQIWPGMAPAFLREQPTIDYLASRLEIPAALVSSEDEREEMAMQAMMMQQQPPTETPQ